MDEIGEVSKKLNVFALIASSLSQSCCNSCRIDRDTVAVPCIRGVYPAYL
jgi:hypothetical protein